MIQHPILRALAVAAGLALAAPAGAQDSNIGNFLGSGEAGMPSAAPSAAGSAGGDTAARFQSVARSYEQAVGLVVVVAPDGQGEYQSYPFGTAWAFAPSLLGTNAHVAFPVAAYIAQGLDVYVLPNRGKGEAYAVTAATGHPRFDEQKPNAYGQTPVGVPYDIGVLQIDGTFPATVALATPEELTALDSGTPVAYLGFPMERLQAGNVNIQNPIATMQTGIVTSMSDYYLVDNGPERNLLIRHNLPATGGASGSPLFLANGKVAGALNAGNINMVEFTTPRGTEAFRIPSAAQINFGQRIDILSDLIDLEAVAAAGGGGQQGGRPAGAASGSGSQNLADQLK